MLSGIIKQVEDRSDALKVYLNLCIACDEAISSAQGAVYSALSERSALSMNLTEEKILRHCNIVTQSYGLFEWCVETMLAFSLTSLPRHQLFTELSPAFRKNYREGIARIIGEIDHRRFRDLDLWHVVKKFSEALGGTSPWELIDDALTFHKDNLRRANLTSLFSSAGLPNIWVAIEKADPITEFVEKYGIDQTLEQLVLELVEFRNDASHGRSDEILGTEALRQRVDFVLAFCQSLSDVVTHHIVSEHVKHAPESILGKVTETYKDNVVVAVCKRCILKVGDCLYFLREMDCKKATIESLQIDDASKTHIHIDGDEIEVGIKTSVPIKKKARLVAMQ